MSQNSGIEWCHDSLNPWWGCKRVSPACANCYAAAIARRFAPQAAAWDGTIARMPNAGIEKQLQRLENAAKPRRVFLGSMTDLGLVAQHDPEGLAHILSRVYRIQWARAHRKPNPRQPHLWIILTKRPKELRRFLDAITWEADTQTFRLPSSVERPKFQGTIPGLCIGITAEDQHHLARRFPDLQAMPLADTRALSAEPLLGPINLGPVLEAERGIDWVITGGETTPRGIVARAMHPEWVRRAAADTLAAGKPFFFKQWGAWEPVAEDTGRRDGSLGCWLGDQPHQWLRLNAKAPQGYPLMAQVPASAAQPIPPDLPQQTPPFPSTTAL